MRLHVYTIIISITVCLLGCEEQEGYTLTLEDIRRHSEKLPGEIYLTKGAQEGPFKQGPGAVGNENTQGSYFVTTDQGRQPEVSWPATPGFYYEASSFLNRSGEAYYIVRKIPFTKKQ